MKGGAKKGGNAKKGGQQQQQQKQPQQQKQQQQQQQQSQKQQQSTKSAASSVPAAAADYDDPEAVPSSPLPGPPTAGVYTFQPTRPKLLAEKTALVAQAAETTASAEGKPTLHMAVVGHVDSGKSTLTAQLLIKSGRFSRTEVDAAKKDAVRLGKVSFGLAFLMDHNPEERERGVTVDVSQNFFATDKYSVTVLDCPGHCDFVPNLVAGVVRADAAILVVSAQPGEFEAGFGAGGQTREHALLVHSLGVTQIIVAVNKLDTYPENYSQARFDEITSTVSEYLVSLGFAPDRIQSVPIAGLSGVNVDRASVAKRPEALSAWYSGPCLLEAVDKFTVPDRDASKGFRMVLTDSHTKNTWAVGKVAAGAVVVGEVLALSPGAVPVLVQEIKRNNVTVPVAVAGEDVELRLKTLITGSAADNAVSAGSILREVTGAGDHLVPALTRFEVQLSSQQARKTIPMLPGTSAVMHSAAYKGPVAITKLVATLLPDGSRSEKPPRFVPSGATAIVELKTLDPRGALVAPLSEASELARFSLRQNDQTVGVGVVTEVRQTAAQAAAIAAEEAAKFV